MTDDQTPKVGGLSSSGGSCILPRHLEFFKHDHARTGTEYQSNVGHWPATWSSLLPRVLPYSSNSGDDLHNLLERYHTVSLRVNKDGLSVKSTRRLTKLTAFALSQAVPKMSGLFAVPMSALNFDPQASMIPRPVLTTLTPRGTQEGVGAGTSVYT